jgi:hypothetical protein
VSRASVNLKDLGADQLRLVHRAGDFLDARAEHGVDVALDPECYLNSWARCPGNARLRKMAFGWREEPKRLISRAKDALEQFRLAGFEVAGCDRPQAGFGTLLVSWARGGDFDRLGVYRDRYIRLAPKDTPRTLWFLISLDGVLPDQLPDNVRVLHRPPHARKVGLRNSTGPFASPARARRSLSGTVAYAEMVASAVETELRRGRFQQVLMPYEAQPFQHAINLTVKALDGGIGTIGYLHSVLPALPTDLMYRSGAPDRLLVHGEGQREILVRHLGWPEGRVRVIPSLRYRLEDAEFLDGQILLPYTFENGSLILRAFENYLRAAPMASMPRWKVRNHPMMVKSGRHSALASRLEALCQKYSNRMSTDPAAYGQSVSIGPTAAVIEALERGLAVVHVCANPLFETQTSELWSYLDVEALGRHLYRYRLIERGRYIVLGRADEPAAEHLGIA